MPYWIWLWNQLIFHLSELLLVFMGFHGFTFLFFSSPLILCIAAFSVSFFLFLGLGRAQKVLNSEIGGLSYMCGNITNNQNQE